MGVLAHSLRSCLAYPTACLHLRGDSSASLASCSCGAEEKCWGQPAWIVHWLLCWLGGVQTPAVWLLQVQAGIPGGPERGEDVNHYTLHVRRGCWGGWGRVRG